MTRLRFVRRGLLNTRRSFAAGLFWSAVAVGTAAALRVALNPWVQGVPFLTFFPAVLLASLFLGWRWGVVVTAAAAATANFLFVQPASSWSLRGADVIGGLAFLASAALIILTAAALRAAVREIDDNARREAALNAELQHRVKNNLAIVQGIARQTIKSAATPDAFYQAFLGRLVALAEAHNALSSGGWEECHLPELAEAAVRPFQEHGAIAVAGPPATVPAASCVPLVLALHELGTNALKYGALSVSSGRVSLTWTVTDGVVVLRWQETGGPAVQPPARRGLGSRLLTRQAGLDAVTVDYAPGGVVCEIRIQGAHPTA